MWQQTSYRVRNSLHNNKLQLLISLSGTIASVVNLILFLDGVWSSLPLAVPFLALLAIIAVVIFKSTSTRSVFSRDDRRGIRDYMFNWIQSGGRVAIWTRDMSWVDDDDMKRLLRQKAEAGELIVCLPKATEVTDWLSQFGAEIITYGTWDSPLGRFTITNYNRDDSRVAVGRGEGQRHVIDEFAFSDNDSTFHLARDLVRLVRKMPNKGSQCLSDQ